MVRAFPLIALLSLSASPLAGQGPVGARPG
jgi:hypothetical protein